jgi:hypothetical protein
MPAGKQRFSSGNSGYATYVSTISARWLIGTMVVLAIVAVVVIFAVSGGGDGGGGGPGY